MLEVLVSVVILVILVVLAFVNYRKTVEQARSSEAVINLASIRQAEALHRAKTGTFADAPDLSAINATLELELSAKDFDYEVVEVTSDRFLAVATRKPPARGPLLRVTMDHTGHIAYDWAPAGGVRGPPIAKGNGGRPTPGGGGGVPSGGAGGGGLGGGSRGGGAAGGSGGGSIPSGGPSPPVFLPPETPSLPASAFKEPNAQERQLIDDAIALLRNSSISFDLFDFASGQMVTHPIAKVLDAMVANGVPILVGTLLPRALAAVFFFTNLDKTFDAAMPVNLVFDRTVLATSTKEMIAAILAHEGWHVQQLFTGIHDDFAHYPRVVDIEYEAFVAGAAVWNAIKGSQSDGTLDAGSDCVAQGEARCKEILATDFQYPTGPR